MILFFIGTFSFISFGSIIGYYYRDDKEFEDLDKFDKIGVSIFTFLCVLGMLAVITSCVIGIIYGI